MATKKVKKEAEVKAPKAAETPSASKTQAAPAQQAVTDLSIGDLKNLEPLSMWLRLEAHSELMRWQRWD